MSELHPALRPMNGEDLPEYLKRIADAMRKAGVQALTVNDIHGVDLSLELPAQWPYTLATNPGYPQTHRTTTTNFPTANTATAGGCIPLTDANSIKFG